MPAVCRRAATEDGVAAARQRATVDVPPGVPPGGGMSLRCGTPLSGSVGISWARTRRDAGCTLFFSPLYFRRLGQTLRAVGGAEVHLGNLRQFLRAVFEDEFLRGGIHGGRCALG